ncbi:hypothetical protein ABE905_10225, partial [Enterococcus durans]|uniref:hypothetical protein n=1 Tax=Enterococcus durans TaxID=53345 RepID=UPI003D6B2109
RLISEGVASAPAVYSRVCSKTVELSHIIFLWKNDRLNDKSNLFTYLIVKSKVALITKKTEAFAIFSERN